jgi:hypothetical protein
MMSLKAAAEHMKSHAPADPANLDAQDSEDSGTLIIMCCSATQRP